MLDSPLAIGGGATTTESLLLLHMVQESDWGLLGKVFWVFLLGGAHEISQLAWAHVTVSSDRLKDVAREREVWSSLLRLLPL